MDWKKTLLISFIILLAGSAITALIFNTEPTASRSGATQQTAMLVNVTDVERATHQPTIRAMGTVEPAQDIVLSPRVGGEITRRSDAFTPGGYVQKGDVLLQIDPADYKNVLQQRQSELRQALADLNLEMGQQRAAQKEYQSYGDTLSEQNKQLVLRKPQLESVQSRVESARAAVRQAELALERTTIRAPFDAHILSRNVNVGSQVAPGENLGRLVGLDTFWIEATVPVSQLRWLSFPDDNRPQSKVIIRNQSAWGPNTTREGHLYKLIGSLEGQTRMARVLIAVPDPYGYHSDTPGVPNLIIGSFVEVRINTKPLPDVIRLNRDYIRDEETVWTMEEGKLRIKEVDIAFNDAQYAYISSGIDEDDQIVTTNLSTVADGAALRVAESDTTSTTNTTP
ncbi:efflux RND transporter periplasmic adaptor subunit [Fodinibius sediminis]|uniref:RND family efflux transporter, MFP subunit n=1 Tax=Fodinibius sediminis TaxID=1214077 RepID=A0A521B6J4_9BACT|nr:efflux RND transporter periplasmic adaptor subunit [Fodinibius sediminis]SMO42732.1 RND family efflux transporter, MFP subunit [Fodinibius sediminis]